MSTKDATHAYRACYPCGCVFALQVDRGTGPDKDILKDVNETGGYLERITLDEARNSTLKRRSDCECSAPTDDLFSATA